MLDNEKVLESFASLFPLMRGETVITCLDNVNSPEAAFHIENNE
jgi:hypothetical protein